MSFEYCFSDYFSEGIELLNSGLIEGLEKAIRCFEKCVEIDPCSTESLNLLSSLYGQAGRKAMALASAVKSVEVSPLSHQAHTALGLAYISLGEMRVGLKFIEIAWGLVSGKGKKEQESLFNLTFPYAPFWHKPLVGKNICLKRWGEEHLDFINSCRLNDEFSSKYNFFLRSGYEVVKKDYEEAQELPFYSSQIQWVIEDTSGKFLGVAALVGFDFNSRRAEFLIGFPEINSSMVALEAALLVLEFAFCTLNMKKIVSYVYVSNLIAQRNTLHLGFSQEGLLLQHVKNPKNGKFQDVFINGLLVESFLGSLKNRKFFPRLLGRSLPDY